MTRREAKVRYRPQIILDISSDLIRAGLVYEPDFIDMENTLVLDKNGQDIIAVSAKGEALEQRLKTGYFEVVKPLVDGRIRQPDAMEYLLKRIINDLVGRYFFILRRPEIYLVLPEDCSDIERAAYRQILNKLSAREPIMVSAQSAVASASGLVLSDEDGVVLNLGYDHSWLSVLANSEFKFRSRVDYTKSGVIELITQWFKREKGLEINRHDAEILFDQALQLMSPGSKRRLKFNGRGVHSGDPMTVVVTIGDINHWLSRELENGLISQIRQFINDIEPNLMARVLHRGLFISGPGADLGGLDKWISRQLKCYARVITKPDQALVEGSRLIITGRDEKWLQKV